MNCIVTGAAGFIGSHICDYLLANGHRVVGIDNLSTGFITNLNALRKKSNFTFYQIDIRDKKAINTAFSHFKWTHVVFHNAALGSVPRSFEHPMETYDVNVNGFQVVLDACMRYNAQRIVFASSSSVYGSNPKEIKTEGCEGKVKSPYAYSKILNEHQAMHYNDVYKLEYYGLRYFNVFGPRQNPEGSYAAVIPKWIKLMKKNQNVIINGDGLTSRDFTHVDNVVYANMLCAVNDKMHARNTIYNVGCGHKITLNKLCVDLALLLNSNSQVFRQDERIGDIKHARANLTKIKNLLDYSPIVEYNKGLEDLCKFL